MSIKYTTTHGATIEVVPSLESATWLNNCRDGLEAMSVREFVRQVIDHPEATDHTSTLHAIAVDLITRKLNTVPQVASEAMSVKEAAEAKNVSVPAIYKAIERGDIMAEKIKGKGWQLNPSSVEEWEPRGAAPLEVQWAEGKDMELLCVHDAAQHRGGSTYQVGGNVELDRWTECHILTTSNSGRDARYWHLAPARENNELPLKDPFGVKGRFKIKNKINNSTKARLAFKEATDRLTP